LGSRHRLQKRGKHSRALFQIFCNVSNVVRFCGGPDSLTDLVQIARVKRAVYKGRNIFFLIGVRADRRSRFFWHGLLKKKAPDDAGA
jgi:hypothetical protein